MTHHWDLVYASDRVDIYRCPTCGREVEIAWWQSGKRIERVVGDRYAGHSGGIGGLEMSADVSQGGEDDDPRLDVFKDFFEKGK